MGRSFLQRLDRLDSIHRPFAQRLPVAMAVRSGVEDEQHLCSFAMVTAQLYRERAKEARQEAKATADPEKRRLLLEVARAYDHFADLPGKTPWHVERVGRKKK